MRKICILLCCSFIIGCFFTTQVYAEESGYVSESDWINEDGEYDFPIDLLSEEWDTLNTRADMLQATQIPANILNSISTPELIALVLKYPLLSELHLYSDNLEGYEVLKENFNGISEVLSREDAYQELLKAYIEFEIPVERVVDYTDIIERDDFADIYNQMLQNEETKKLMLADCEVYNTVDLLELMLLELSQNVQERSGGNAFWDAYYDKVSEKEKSAYYNTVASGNLIASIVNEDMGNDVELAAVSSVGITINGDGTCTLSVPGSGTVVCKYVTTLSYLDPSEYTGTVAAYNATLISKASTTFNCHSYAWLCNTLNSHYQYIWLDTATQFMASSYYSKESTPTATGRIASWSSHSALVTDISKSNPYNNGIPEPYCVSKWGAGPMVAHYLSLCPYYSSSSGIQYYY